MPDAESATGEGRESMRFNPRWRWARSPHPDTVYQQDVDDRNPDRAALSETLRRARDRRAALARVAPWPKPGPALEPPKDWSVHASALLTVERVSQSLLDE